MSEIIVLTREQYFTDLHQAATTAADFVLKRFVENNTPATVSRAQASRLLGKTKATIKNMIDQQRLRTSADGTCIPYSEIKRYLNQQ